MVARRLLPYRVRPCEARDVRSPDDPAKPDDEWELPVPRGPGVFFTPCQGEVADGQRSWSSASWCFLQRR
jgi:hypothetical protein